VDPAFGMTIETYKDEPKKFKNDVKYKFMLLNSLFDYECDLENHSKISFFYRFLNT